MRTQLRILLALTALALPAQTGCSFMGLDKIDRQTCTEDSQCSTLEMVQSTGNACRTWQCNNAAGARGVCVIDTRDDDADGSPPAMCVVAPAAPDCDDADGSRSPLLIDRCNLSDDDCDGVIDEGFAAGPGGSVAETSSSARVSFSRSAMSTDVSVVDIFSGMPVRRGTVAAGGSALALQPITGVSNPDRNVGAHATLGGAGSILVFDPVSADRTCLPTESVCGDGICNPQTEAPSLVMACAADCPCAGPSCSMTPNVCGNGRCDTDETVANCYTDCNPVVGHWLRVNGTIASSICMEPTGLASATLTPEPGGDALLVWVDDTATRTCGTARAATVHARLLRTATGDLESSNIMDLGTTTDWLGPSAVFVEGVGFIVAHTTASGDIELHRIPVPDMAGFNTLAATSIGLSGATGAGEVSLALAGGTEIAVSYVEGACTSNRVVFQRANVTATAATWQSAVNLQPAADAGRHGPVASRNGTIGSTEADRHGEWVVFYRQRDEAFAQRLRADAAATTGNPIRVMPADRSEGRAYVEPTGASWGYLTTTSNAASPSVNGIVSGSLACIDPS